MDTQNGRSSLYSLPSDKMHNTRWQISGGNQRRSDGSSDMLQYSFANERRAKKGIATKGGPTRRDQKRKRSRTADSRRTILGNLGSCRTKQNGSSG